MAIPSIRRLRRIAIGIVVAAALALPWVLAWPWLLSVLSGQWPTWIVIALAIDAALLLLAAIWWLWWRLPGRQVARLSLKIRDAKARADVEDNFRKTVGQALGGAAVLIGAGAAYLQFTQQQQAARDLLISNQVSKGFEQLAGEKMEMRLGGIYALEGVMNSQYRVPVLEALCAFVRDHTVIIGPPPATLMTDVEAVLTIIRRRRNPRPYEVDLARANIPGANLIEAHLEHANLVEAHLEGANLTLAHLEGVDLGKAHLERADLVLAHLDGAHFELAHLERADLGEAHLDGASLALAHLDGADLERALGLTQAQIDGTFGDAETKLPEGLTPPASWRAPKGDSAPAPPKPPDLP